MTGSFLVRELTFQWSSAAAWITARSFIERMNVSHRFRILKSGRWGFIDETGTEVIPCEFAHVSDFSDGYAVVQTGSPRVCLVTDGRLVVIDGEVPQRSALLDLSGRITPMPFRVYLPPTEGRLLFTSEEDRSGIADMEGNIVLPAIYDSISSFSEGLAIAKCDGKYGVVDRSGVVRVPFDYSILWDFSEGLAPAACGDGRWGFIDVNGTPVVDFQFGRTERFSEGLAVVDLWGRGLSGYIDTTGRVIIECRFDYADKFASGLAAAEVERRRSGFIDRSGSWVIEPQFRHASAFSEGLAIYTTDPDEMRWGYINGSGERVIPDVYPGVEPFRNSLACVHYHEGDERRSGYINRHNEFIWSGGDDWYPG